MKKILCPVDFSEASINAMDYAANVAKTWGASVSLLHVLPTSAVVVDDASFSTAYLHKKESLRENLERSCQEIKESFGIDCDYHLDKEYVEDDVPTVASKGNYDLVIMGTGGASDLFEFYTGTNTARTVEHCDCPILVIPYDFLYAEINKIVFATNYTGDESEYVSQLVDFANYFNAHLTILHVSHNDTAVSKEVFKSYKDMVTNQVKDLNKLHFERVVASDIAEGIEGFLSIQNADVLALITKHRNFFQKMFHNSISRKMSMFSDYPVLIFHK